LTGLGGAEQALWLLQRLVPGHSVSNVAVAIEMDRPVRWWPLQQALDWLCARHPAMRTSFPEVDAVPARATHPVGEVVLEVRIPATGPDTVDDDMRRFAAEPFDLGVAPLIRVGLFAVSPDRAIICLAAHHIVVDASSVATLVAELGEAYVALAQEQPPPQFSPTEPVPSAQPSLRTMSYWRQHLDGFDANGMVLEGARPIGMEPSFAGELLETALSPQAVSSLTALRKHCRSTDASVLLAVYYLLLRRHGAASDAVVGVMADTRGSRTANAVGYHVATMPMRAQVDDDISFTELVRRVTAAMTAALDHGLATYEMLAPQDTTAAGGDHAWWRSRLVRHLFNFRPGRSSYRPAGPGSLFREVPTGLSRFDLELTVEPVEGMHVVKLLYSTEVHDKGFATRLLDLFDVVLCQAAAGPDVAVADFDLRTRADHDVVSAANRTDVIWPDEASVLELVSRVASSTPDAVAIVENGVSTTYRQLFAAAGKVSEEIRAHCPESGAVVAIAAPRGAGTAAAVLGVWLAGAVYLPLDPEHPAERLVYQLDDAGCQLVLGGAGLPVECATGRRFLPVPVLPVPVMPEPGDADGGPRPVDPGPAAPAYLIYTSGSTGRPKGVVLSHANLANVVRHFGRALTVTQADSMAWLTTFAFDISALELFLPLAHGGRVIVAPDEARTDPDLFVSLIETHDVSIVQATPTTWRLVAPAARGKLTGRWALCGGEPLPAALALRLRETGARVVNVYGPTETTIWSTSAEVTGGEITVGTPIANTKVAVLDPRGRPVAVGMTGELCIGGAGVASHYHRRAELTAERFGDDAAIGRFYRTGDLARWRPDGALELLGRADRQVKLHGHRIELGEVESVLEDHPEVRSAAVLLRGDPAHEGCLVAFVAADDRPGIGADLWAHAARQLPVYSVPALFRVLPELPVTANAKVDLPTLARLAESEPVDGTAPADDHTGTGLVADLTGTWRAVLGRQSVTSDSNFFLSGGNSLLAVRLARTVTDQLRVPVSMAMIFRAPTPAALAALVDRTSAVDGAV
jgi:amino acid adenylation domain-containing protein